MKSSSSTWDHSKKVANSIHSNQYKRHRPLDFRSENKFRNSRSWWDNHCRRRISSRFFWSRIRKRIIWNRERAMSSDMILNYRWLHLLISKRKIINIKIKGRAANLAYPKITASTVKLNHQIYKNPVRIGKSANQVYLSAVVVANQVVVKDIHMCIHNINNH